MYLEDFDHKVTTYTKEYGNAFVFCFPSSRVKVAKQWVYHFSNNHRTTCYGVFTEEKKPFDLSKYFINETQEKACLIDLDFHSTPVYYYKIGSRDYRICLKLPCFRNTRNENIHDFLCIMYQTTGWYAGKLQHSIEECKMNTPRCRMKPLSTLDTFNNLSKEEKLSLLGLITSNSEQNFLLAFNILNLL